MVALEQERANLQEKANESEDEAIQAQADLAEEAFEATRADLREKMMEKLTRIVAEKFGEQSPLLAPISLALCQDMGILLKNNMQKLALEKYEGELTLSGTDPKIVYTYALELPEEGAVAAKITVEASGKFHLFTPKGEQVPRELAAPCFFEGTAIISIDHEGKALIESSVDLIPMA